MNKVSAKRKQRIPKKLAVYSAVAVSALAAAQPAQAAIVYSGTQNLSFNGANPLRNIDLNSDAQNDFVFQNQDIYAVSSNQFLYSFYGIGPGTGNPGYGHTDAAFLPQNYSVRSNPAATFLHWTSGAEPVAGGPYSTGSFDNRTGFIGVRFHSVQCQGTDWNYGWISFSNTGGDNSTIVDWAYDNTCNTPILAGAGSSAPAATAVPTLGEWGMMAMAGLLGAASLHRIRKYQKKT